MYWREVQRYSIFQDFKYEGKSSEEVYDEIYKKYDEEELKQLGQLLDEHIDWEKQDGPVQAPTITKRKRRVTNLQ